MPTTMMKHTSKENGGIGGHCTLTRRGGYKNASDSIKWLHLCWKQFLIWINPPINNYEICSIVINQHDESNDNMMNQMIRFKL